MPLFRHARGRSVAVPAVVTAVLAALLSALAPATAAHAAQSRTVSGGRLDWGIKASFQSYVTGPIAQGSWNLTGSAGTIGSSQFRFPSAQGSYDPGTGTLNMRLPGRRPLRGAQAVQRRLPVGPDDQPSHPPAVRPLRHALRRHAQQGQGQRQGHHLLPGPAGQPRARRRHHQRRHRPPVRPQRRARHPQHAGRPRLRGLLHRGHPTRPRQLLGGPPLAACQDHRAREDHRARDEDRQAGHGQARDGEARHGRGRGRRLGSAPHLPRVRHRGHRPGPLDAHAAVPRTAAPSSASARATARTTPRSTRWTPLSPAPCASSACAAPTAPTAST